jgi:hypothetical protein
MAFESFNYEEHGRMTGTTIDPVYWMMENIPLMVGKARQLGRKDAHSYRDFVVPGGMISLNEHDKIIGTDVAGNLKRANKGKVCFERKLLTRAKNNGMTSVLAIVGLATTNRTEIAEVSDLRSPTLHLCSDCRHAIPASPLVSPSTICFTSGIESDVNQAFQLGFLTDAYAKVEAGETVSELYASRPDMTDWDARKRAYQTMVGPNASHEFSVDQRLHFATLALSKSVTA